MTEVRLKYILLTDSELKAQYSLLFPVKKSVSRKEGSVQESIQLPNTFRPKKVREKSMECHGVPQSQTTALPRPQDEQETDKSK